jgi:hypothetical protein
VKAVVVIPIYKTKVEGLEYKSLLQCKNILHKHKIIFIHPLHLDTSFYEKEIPLAQFQAFDIEYFNGINGYNKLLLSPFFYKKFLSYKFMLIYQLDAWVFRDNLDEWCNKNYDYIGAPYTLENINFTGETNLKKRDYILNGGLSLRNIKSCLRVCRIFDLLFRESYNGNEDAFFSGVYARFFFVKYLIKLPDFKTAIKFAMEKEPKKMFELNNSKLPFGCHAFEKYDLIFWQKHGIL